MIYRTLTFPYQFSYLEIIFHSNPQDGKSKNSPPNSCGACEGEIHTWAVDPSSQLPAGSAPFKYGKWGSGRPSLPPADGKQNQGFSVPGALSFKMRIGPTSYLIMHEHNISTQEAKAMNTHSDIFNAIIWN